MTANGSMNQSGHSSYEELKVVIHERLLDSIDLSRANMLEEVALKEECERRLRALLESVQPPISSEDREKLRVELLNDVFGLGPLQELMSDTSISDIVVNGPSDIFVEQEGQLRRVPVSFRDEEHLLKVIRRIVSYSGRRLDEGSPMVDARLPDGSRVNAVIPPLALDGPLLSIRRFGNHELSMEALVDRDMLPEEVSNFLQACVRSRFNMVISGGSGAGKTTLLNALSTSIIEDERVITIEDAAELKLRQSHVVRLETRPANLEGAGEITTRDAVRNALRMRPDRILVGECRGSEAFDMLQAMNSGHSGSMTTMHANGSADAFRRLEAMLCMAGMEVPVSVLREYVASAIDIVIQLERMSGGRRRVVAVSEVLPLEGGVVQIEDIYRYRINDMDPANGWFEATGHVPRSLARLNRLGVQVSPDSFQSHRIAGSGSVVGEDATS